MMDTPTTKKSKFHELTPSVLLVGLLWPFGTLPYGLDVYITIVTGNSHWGVMSMIITGGLDWPLFVFIGGIVGSIYVLVALARDWASGRLGALFLCWSAILVWLIGTLAECLGPTPTLALLPFLLLVLHILVVVRLHRTPR